MAHWLDWDGIQHHAANLAAMGIPLLVNLHIHTPLILAYGPGVLGMIWYSGKIAHDFYYWWKHRKDPRYPDGRRDYRQHP